LISRERHYLLDILLAAESALSYVRGLNFESFVETEIVQHAVLHCLTILGEAAGRITDASAAEVPDLPWRKMKNLRNVIVHEYEGVNMPIIWDVVTMELPRVVAALDGLFPERKTQ
jgi:uncharacterized protein with HEPN domain